MMRGSSNLRFRLCIGVHSLRRRERSLSFGVRFTVPFFDLLRHEVRGLLCQSLLDTLGTLQDHISGTDTSLQVVGLVLTPSEP